ncbi:sigma-70 family RNA polymerase sigma factor [Terriglobus tenax]|uniref:sigma-70 family RNA polymerase sigma factor n=1 Tax=Terriglobus tenax TaxID=1111115 RepID=UPI0021E085CA|nr:sigma-70 family RNA polymerase sigma factor [Terriglobus tenax]
MSETMLSPLLEQRKQFLSFVRRRVNDPALAEDILQAAYLRAMKHEGDFEGEESAVAWFYRVLRNAVIDQYRRHATENKALAYWGREMEGETAPAPGIRDEICACLTKVVDGLTPNYASLLRAVDLGEQPLHAFAEEHHLSGGNAAVRAHRARAALRKELIKTCGSCSEHGCMDCTCRRA